jgi:hypothetical integral membrane protein (TIGR02206 family)
MSEATFTLLGISHISVIALLFLFSIGLTLSCRRRPSCDKKIAWSLATALIINKLFTLYYAWTHQLLAWDNGLPLHLCDVATFFAVWCLIDHRPRIAECVYFWGLAGTTQAVLTPDLPFNFPDPRFITFFISHCGLIVAAIYIIFGRREELTWQSVWRVFGWSQIYLIAVLVINKLISANYGYLLAKPKNPSLLDYFGPWPFYLLVIEAMALLFFILYFQMYRWIEKK